MSSPDQADVSNTRLDGDERGLDHRALLALVREIAQFARPEGPDRVSMQAFNTTRAGSGHPEAPTAEAIHLRFNSRASGEGSKASWREIVRAACSSTDPGQWLAQRFGQQANQTDLSDEDCWYALRVVCRELGGESFPPGRYTEVRERLIRRDKRRPSGGLMSELLPTADQILYHFDHDWRNALAAAGLPLFEQARRTERVLDRNRARGGIPMVDAIETFAQLNERLPGKRVLYDFCREWGVEIETRERGKRYETYLEEAERRFRERGEAVPRRPDQFDLRLAMRIPQERPASVSEYGRGSTFWTEETIIEKLREYVRLLRGERGTQRHYRQTLAAHPEFDWPAASTISEHNLRFQEALDEARRREREAEKTIRTNEDGAAGPQMRAPSSDS